MGTMDGDEKEEHRIAFIDGITSKGTRSCMDNGNELSKGALMGLRARKYCFDRIDTKRNRER